MLSPQVSPSPNTLNNNSNNKNNNSINNNIISTYPEYTSMTTKQQQQQVSEDSNGRPIHDIAQEFTYRLKDLTYNDAIIINKLMHFAQDNIVAAKEISALIEDRIRKSVNPKQRLAVLYLMDSIIKNVGKIYKQLFARDIVNTYCASFEAVDDTIKTSLFNLYNTWTGYFDPVLLEKIQQRCGVEEMARIAILKKQQVKPPQKTGHPQKPSSSSSSSSRPTIPSPTGSQQPQPHPQKQPPSQQQQQPSQQQISSQQQQQLLQQQQQQQRMLQQQQQQQQLWTQQQQQSQNKLNVGINIYDQWSGLLTQNNYPNIYNYDMQQQVQDPRVNKGSAPNYLNGQFNNQLNQQNNNMMTSNNNMNIMNNGMMNSQQQQQFNNNYNNNNVGMNNYSLNNMFPAGVNNNQNYNNFNNMIQSFNLNTSGSVPNQTNMNQQQQQQWNQNNAGNYSYFNNMNASNLFMNGLGEVNPNNNNNNNNITNTFQQGGQQQPQPQQQQQQQSNNPNAQEEHSQIQQEQSQLYKIIEQCGTILASEPENDQVKALLTELENTLYRGSYNQANYAFLKQKFTNITGISIQASNSPLPIGNVSNNIINNNNATNSKPSDDSTSKDDNTTSEPFNPAVDLYDALPLQCKTCALRFNDDELFKLHMDWHWRVNKKEKKKKKQAMSRSWYITEDEWIAFECGVTEIHHEQPALPFLNAKNKKEDEQKPLPNLVADDEQPNCPICREKFDKFWDESNEEWMYRAVELNEKINKIVHVKCNGSPKLDDTNGINKTPSPPVSLSSSSTTINNTINNNNNNYNNNNNSSSDIKLEDVSIIPSPKPLTKTIDKKRELEVEQKSELIESNSDSPERDAKKLKNE
ncbi:ENTH domain-containing protein [Heterostelium album PN500]|uniref:ENTH domain-containing protein n=1 Tax=Heterostelium pallidum (strain ATCC 26659 / Pp 5 / PN500) TaxID=670386 RepID=D3BIM6_HETP5|nr:ENTH domain-containing protein [Heterostelium album PN500]EFA78650.1 ENTH domain-containing protein [Heterostelium album PN500]|eukprot:XP_020430774.1 ENTH domain-containing protein [Heterostelium album PN500]